MSCRIPYIIGLGAIGKRALLTAMPKPLTYIKSIDADLSLKDLIYQEPIYLGFGHFGILSGAEKLAKQILNVDLKKVNYVDKFVTKKNGVKFNETSLSNRRWWNKNL